MRLGQLKDYYFLIYSEDLSVIFCDFFFWRSQGKDIYEECHKKLCCFCHIGDALISRPLPYSTMADFLD